MDLQSLINVYLALGTSTLAIALISVLIPSIRECKPPASLTVVYSLSYIVTVAAVYPCLIYLFLFRVKQVRGDTQRSILKVMETW